MTITIYYTNGTVETFYGDMSISKDGIIHIIPQCGRGSPTGIPCSSILKYTMDR